MGREKILHANGAIVRGAPRPLKVYGYTQLYAYIKLHADPQGSTIAVTDASAVLVGIDSYDDYGKMSASSIGRYEYTGQLWINEVGLYMRPSSRVWSMKRAGYSHGKGRVGSLRGIRYCVPGISRPVSLMEVIGAIERTTAQLTSRDYVYFTDAAVKAMRTADRVAAAGGISGPNNLPSYAGNRSDRIDIQINYGRNIVYDQSSGVE